MKLFATGTSGLIGSRLNGVDSLPLRLEDENSYPTESRKLEATVIHLAGIVGESKVKQNRNRAFEINVERTCDFALFIKRFTNWRFLFVSSSHVYKPSGNFHKETDPIEPFSEYGLLKWQTECKLRSIFKDEAYRLCIARVFSVLDRGMPRETLGWAIENLGPETPLRNTEDIRDFLKPSEIATYLKSLAANNFYHSTINICSSRKTSVRDACISLRSSIGLLTDARWLMTGNSTVPIILGDNSRLLASMSLIKEL